MIIRKQFKFEMAHIVRKAYSKKCSQNIHGHSYLLEVFFEGDPNYLDNAGMVIDFGLIKNKINNIIDSFDHSMMLWDIKEDNELNNFIKKTNKRWICSPYPTTAEYQSKIFFNLFADILDNFLNENIILNKVRVHETKTGWAEYHNTDYINDLNKININKFNVSEELKDDWKW